MDIADNPLIKQFKLYADQGIDLVVKHFLQNNDFIYNASIDQAEQAKIDNTAQAKVDQAEQEKSKINTTLLESLSYCLSNPNSKLLRPILTLAYGHILFDLPLDLLLMPATSIELIHCYSLVHDDLPCMDDALWRRKLPSCHIAFGEAMAVLTGDALQTMAFSCLSTPGFTKLPDNIALACIRDLALASGHFGMILGQAQDLALDKQKLGVTMDSVSIEQLQGLHRNKTGALFLCCFKLPLLISQKSKDSALVQYGWQLATNLGLAFQILDDIIDNTKSFAELGKTPGADLKNNKCSYVNILGLEQTQAKYQQLLQNIKQILAALTNYINKSSVEKMASIIDYILPSK